jgi:hypothetical protein
MNKGTSSSAFSEAAAATRQVKETPAAAETVRGVADAVQTIPYYYDSDQPQGQTGHQRGGANGDGNGHLGHRVFSAVAVELTPTANQSYGDGQSCDPRGDYFARAQTGNAPRMFGDTSINDIQQQLHKHQLQHRPMQKHQQPHPHHWPDAWQQLQHESSSPGDSSGGGSSTSAAFYDDLEGEIKSLQSRIMGRLDGDAAAVAMDETKIIGVSSGGDIA